MSGLREFGSVEQQKKKEVAVQATKEEEAKSFSGKSIPENQTDQKCVAFAERREKCVATTTIAKVENVESTVGN